MFLLQNRIIRIIAGVNRRTDTTPYYNTFGILPIEKIYSYNVGLFMYKHHHGGLSQIFDIFQRNSEIRYHNTRQFQLLYQPKPRTEREKRSFRYQAVQLWNRVYDHLDVYIKIGTFKKNLKHYLLN